MARRVPFTCNEKESLRVSLDRALVSISLEASVGLARQLSLERDAGGIGKCRSDPCCSDLFVNAGSS